MSQVLREVDGDVDAAIEFLIADQESDDNANASKDNPCHGNVLSNMQFVDIFCHKITFFFLSTWWLRC